MFKTLGLIALALVITLLWAPKVHAADIKTGTLTVGYGQAAINAEDQLYLIDEGLTVDQTLKLLDQPIQISGTLVGNHLTDISDISTPGGHILYHSTIARPIGGAPLAPSQITGTLSIHLYTYQPILSRVTPEVYYGSYDVLRLPLTLLSAHSLEAYNGRQITVEGNIYPDEYGEWQCTVSRIWVDGTEI